MGRGVPRRAQSLELANDTGSRFDGEWASSFAKSITRDFLVAMQQVLLDRKKGGRTLLEQTTKLLNLFLTEKTSSVVLAQNLTAQRTLVEAELNSLGTRVTNIEGLLQLKSTGESASGAHLNNKTDRIVSVQKQAIKRRNEQTEEAICSLSERVSAAANAATIQEKSTSQINQSISELKSSLERLQAQVSEKGQSFEDEKCRTHA